MYTTKPHAKHLLKHPLFAVGLFVLLIAIVSLLEFTNTTHIFHKKSTPLAPATAGQSTKGEQAASANKSSAATSNGSNPSTGTNSTQPGDSKGESLSTTNLVNPTGTFVSAHKNVPQSATLSSVCNTTAGASCQIVFNSSSVTKSLSAQITDRGGATYWNSWTPANIGLTPGTWQVQATATLNGQSKTSTDALNLEVVQ